MKKLSPAIMQSSLFEGIEEEDIKSILKCLSAKEKKTDAGMYIFRAEDKVRLVYLIVQGSMHIVDEDYWGNRTIIETMHEQTLFGEAYVFAKRSYHLVSVIAAEDSIILEIDPHKLFEACACQCECHSILIKNALYIVSEKIVRLTEKLGHIAQRSIREKVLSYLSKCSRQAHNNSFDIPYSRQQFADYLCVERSALSHELSRLKKEGLIEYKKNHFKLLGGQYQD